jgi:hypothetical protein
MKQPKKQAQQVIWYLYNWDNFSMKDVIIDSMFYKFQARLHEIELKFGIITNKTRHNFKNKFGNKGSYFTYNAIDKIKLLDLFYRV